MKKYKRVKREESDVDSYKKKDPDLCIGKKPHDFVLVLPDYVDYDPSLYKFNPETYYVQMRNIETFRATVNASLKEQGILVKESSRIDIMYFVCSKCKKKKIGQFLPRERRKKLSHELGFNNI